MHGLIERLSIRSRVLILLLLSMAPLFLVAAATRPMLSLLAVIAGGILTLSVTSAAVVRPHDRLARAIDRWQVGAPFDMTPERLPVELGSLVAAVLRGTARLTEREAALRAATVQQELLMQEIHHRVKNNLQIVASLLNLQASRIKVPAARAEFQSARDRVRALATVHRHLYAHGELHTINLRAFLAELCGQLFSAFGEVPGVRIALHIDAPELQMSSDQAVPLALIVTETVSNAVKYAFPDGRRGNVTVKLTADDETAELAVIDDGVGLEAGQAASGDGVGEGRRDGIGLQLIRGFARQLGGTLSVEDGNGTRYVIRLPLRRERPALAPIGARSAA